MAKLIEPNFSAVIVSPSKSHFSISLCRYLESQMNLACRIIRNVEQRGECDLLIFNREEYSDVSISIALKSLHKCEKKLKCFIFNIENTESDNRLAQWAGVKGACTAPTDIKLWAQGVQKVLDGEIWLPRHISSWFMKNKRRRTTLAYNLSEENYLTKREIQIIKLIARGQQNKQIATGLFISEYTIKSHLYNIYQKLEISTRLEASNWVHEHMPDEDDI